MLSPNVTVVASLALLTRTPFICCTRWQWCSKPAIHCSMVILVQLFKEIIIIVYFINFMTKIWKGCVASLKLHMPCAADLGFSSTSFDSFWLSALFLIPGSLSIWLQFGLFFTSMMPKTAVWIEDIWPHKTSPTQDILVSLFLITSTNQ